MGVVFFKESDGEVHLARILDLGEFCVFWVVVKTLTGHFHGLVRSYSDVKG